MFNPWDTVPLITPFIHQAANPQCSPLVKPVSMTMFYGEYGSFCVVCPAFLHNPLPRTGASCIQCLINVGYLQPCKSTVILRSMSQCFTDNGALTSYYGVAMCATIGSYLTCVEDATWMQEAGLEISQIMQIMELIIYHHSYILLYICDIDYYTYLKYIWTLITLYLN